MPHRLKRKKAQLSNFHLHIAMVTKWINFWSGWGLVIKKSGSLPPTSSENCHSSGSVRQHKRYPSQDWRPGRICCVFQWIGKKSYTMSYAPSASWRNQSPKTAHCTDYTHRNLWELGSEVLMHPFYSPDRTLSDYHLFLPKANDLASEELGWRDAFSKKEF